MAAKKDSKLFKQLLRELLYNGTNIVYAHGQFKVPLTLQLVFFLYILTSFKNLFSKKFLENIESSLFYERVKLVKMVIFCTLQPPLDKLFSRGLVGNEPMRGV